MAVDTQNRLLLPLLSLTAGYVDTAGFLALQGLFTAHVTGNFVTLLVRDARGKWGSNEMGYFWLGRSVELADDVLNDSIGIRYALVLAKVLEPGRDHERFQEAPFLGRVFENVPGVRTVPPSLLAQISDRGQESITSPGIDTVFDGDQYWPPVSVCLDRHNRSRPMHRRREIHSRATLQLPAPGQCNSSQSACGRDKMRCG